MYEEKTQITYLNRKREKKERLQEERAIRYTPK